MKRLLLMMALLIPTVAAAEGRRVYDENAQYRFGAGCRLVLYGMVYSGRCNVARAWDSPNSVIQVGNVFFRIERDPGSLTGDFFQVKGGRSVYVSPVVARRRCWVGPNVSFCAN
jgi:hypothetical protein